MAEPDRLTIRRATLADIDRILEIENVSFTSPWPRVAFLEELSREMATYLVAVDAELVGYAGMWCVVDEAHIMNIAVSPAARRRGIGEALVLALIDEAVQGDADLAYLEYRESNAPAQELYAKLGFAPIGRRPLYYRDTREDAIVMLLTDLQDRWQADAPRHWRRWEERHGQRPTRD